MKTNVLLWTSAGIYFGLALFSLLSLIWWSDYTGRPLGASVFFSALFLASMGVFLGFAALRARKGSLLWMRVLAISGGMFAGIAALGSWEAALVFAVPLAIAAFALWRSGMLPNSAPHRDGREALHAGQPSSAPARGRER